MGDYDYIALGHVTVDVRAEMGVGVEDVQAGREVGTQPHVPLGADLPCPDPEDLHDPAQLPPGWVLAAADPAALPGQWVDAGMSAWFSHTNRAALALARWVLATSRAQAGTRERVPDRRRAHGHGPARTQCPARGVRSVEKARLYPVCGTSTGGALCRLVRL